MTIQGLLLIVGFGFCFTGIVECSGIEDMIPDDEKCRMLQEAGMATLPIWDENRYIAMGLFVDLDLLERNGWDLDDHSNLEERLCRIAVAKTKRSLAEAFGLPEKDFRRQYREIKRTLKQRFKGPAVFDNGATTFFDFMFFAQSVGLDASNPRPEINYDQAMDFVDDVVNEHGDTYLYDMTVFASAGRFGSYNISVENNDLARAIYEAQSAREFAEISGLQEIIVDMFIDLVAYSQTENPDLLNYMTVTAEYVRVASEIGFYSIKQ